MQLLPCVSGRHGSVSGISSYCVAFSIQIYYIYNIWHCIRHINR
jgi:hypothetical protein